MAKAADGADKHRPGIEHSSKLLSLFFLLGIYLGRDGKFSQDAADGQVSRNAWVEFAPHNIVSMEQSVQNQEQTEANVVPVPQNWREPGRGEARPPSGMTCDEKHAPSPFLRCGRS